MSLTTRLARGKHPSLTAFALLLALSVSASAQPVQTPLGPSILDTGTELFDTQSFTVDGPDGGADYAIGILIPHRICPPEGLPAIFLLDGQAALEVLTTEFLGALDPQSLPVIVTVGYDTDRRFASEERARDYTPPDASGAPVDDPRGRAGGHAPAFLELLTSRIVPEVEARAPVDAKDLTLWGHSYGGLFVLQMAGAPRSLFARHVAASPSLWWDEARFLDRILSRMHVGDWPNRRLDLDRGGKERERASRPNDPRAQKLVQMRSALPADSFDTLVRAVRGAGIPGETTVFPGLSHGETFRASIRHLLTAGAERGKGGQEP